MDLIELDQDSIEVMLDDGKIVAEVDSIVFENDSVLGKQAVIALDCMMDDSYSDIDFDFSVKEVYHFTLNPFD